MKDISFVEKKDKFNFRVAAVIFDVDRSHILIHKKIYNDFWMLPGGRVQFGEDSLSGIKREIYEEIGLQGKFELAYICENFFNLNDINYHEICMFYYMNTQEKICEEKFISSKESNDQIFKWIPKEEIKKYNIEPAEVIERLEEKDSVKNIIIRKK